MHPFIVALKKNGRVRFFGAKGDGNLVTNMRGLWSDEPVLPGETDLVYEIPTTTGYFLFELIVGQLPIVVSVYEEKGEPKVSVLGVAEGIPLATCAGGRWSAAALVPPEKLSSPE